jgi:TolB-like protein/DNA-binding winged helix-turn-helix (wHTH) protein
MNRLPPTPKAVRFGLFEADLAHRILTKGGLRIKLQDQPFQVLAMLLDRAGELVTREDLRQQLWPADTFVEFDDGLNTAIKKLRAALRDSADNPRFIETVPRRGYRFLAPVTTRVSVQQTDAGETEQSSPSDFEAPASTQDVTPSATSSEISANPVPEGRAWARSWTIIAVAALALCAAALFTLLLKPQLFSRRPLASARTTLIVIPLDNLSGDPQQEYFSDGITEEITTQLALLDPNRLGVIGRLTAMRYKHSGKDIAQIGKEVAVNYVLEGSIRREHNRIRATVQLIDVATETHIWAEEYDRDWGDTLGLQREIATAVAGQIKMQLTAEQKYKLASATSAEAHDAYLRGRYEWSKRSEEGLRAAIVYFDEALRKQSDYALAYAGLADAYNLLGEWGFAAPEDAYPKAKAYAEKALQLDGTLAEAYTALADVEIKYDRAWRNAESDFSRAIQLDPNYATAHLWYAEDVLTPSGRREQAIAEVKKAQQIEPLSPIIGAIVAETFYFARDYDHAIGEAQRVLEMEPTFLPALERLGWAYEQKAMFPQATAQFQKAFELSQGSSRDEMKTQLAHVYARSGRGSEARKILSELLAESRNHYVSPYFLAVIYAALDEKQPALDWLERTYQAHDVPPLQVEPRFDSLRTEPRFQELLRRVGPQ